VLIGLRDKTVFMAARGEQYLAAMVFFAVLPFVDMIIALKLLIYGADRTVTSWLGRPAGDDRGGAFGARPELRSNRQDLWMKIF
jgi:hypothetical protein